MIGLMYEEGNGVNKDLTEAIKYYHQGAEGGFAWAQCRLGLMYARGIGVENDDELAVEWYQLAAAQDDDDAQFNLGMMFADGRGVDKDIPLALSWLDKAAHQGHQDAMIWCMTLRAGGDYSDEVRSEDDNEYQTDLTFGFMDSSRGVDQNYDLYKKTCQRAIKAFNAEKVCDLSTFADDTLEDLENILPKSIGLAIGSLRDRYFSSISTVRLPDIQSFFLYAFTLQLNKYSLVLLSNEAAEELLEIGSPYISNEQILERGYPVIGPQWLCDAVNREMPHLENVFCDFQNELIIPASKSSLGEPRLLADIIALVLYWGQQAGWYWFREIISQLTSQLAEPWNQGIEPIAMYQVKRSMLLIEKEDIEKVLELNEIFFGEE